MVQTLRNSAKRLARRNALKDLPTSTTNTLPPTIVPTPTLVPTPTIVPTPTMVSTPTMVPTPTETPTPTLIPLQIFPQSPSCCEMSPSAVVLPPVLSDSVGHTTSTTSIASGTDVVACIVDTTGIAPIAQGTGAIPDSGPCRPCVANLQYATHASCL